MAAYLSFWGKAGGAVIGQPAWHPIAYHSLDVAAVAEALLDQNPHRSTTLAAGLGTSDENAQRFLVCLVALHDVGKFSRDFQAKCPELWTETAGPQLGDWRPSPPMSRHDQDGYAVRELLGLRELLNPATEGWSATTFNSLWAAVAGHHGQPCNDEDHLPRGFGTASRSAAAEFCRDVPTLFDPMTPIPEPEEPQRPLFILSWLLCGLMVIADWIGSKSGLVFLSPTEAGCRRLLELRAGEGAGGRSACRHHSFGAPPSIDADASVARDRRKAQPFTAARSRDAAVRWAVIDDHRGCDRQRKTEAALLLAARLMALGRARGLFFALPTMATSNAMYDRFAESYRRLFVAAARPSLILAHGRRTLNVAFTNSILAETATDDGYDDGNAAACAAWIADDRRKVFLTPRSASARSTRRCSLFCRRVIRRCACGA